MERAASVYVRECASAACMSGPPPPPFDRAFELSHDTRRMSFYEITKDTTSLKSLAINLLARMPRFANYSRIYPAGGRERYINLT